MIELNKVDINIYEQIQIQNKGISFEELLMDNNIKKEKLIQSLKKLKNDDIIYYEDQKFKKRW